MEYLLVALAVLMLIALHVTWLAGRIERLHARSAAAREALEDQLVRRASAAAGVSGPPGVRPEVDRLHQAARAALTARTAELDLRQVSENELTRALRAATLDPSDPTVLAATVANRRLGVARQVYNDAVRDTRSLRQAKVPRVFRLGARHPLPHYFDIDEFDVDAPRVGPTAAVPARGPGAAGVGEATPGTA
ncbi:MAG TPA: NUDIX hydrolase [Cryptosporangiaceae bacterium]|nr:NUDIX hydrolase [Cryptosporangiaceae bacterium]